MRRREFIAGLGGAVAWPLAARAQQTGMPVLGYLYSGLAERNALNLAAFREGLRQAGYVEGRNVVIEFRWADLQFEQLPALADDLVRRRVAVIVTGGGIQTALAAKRATSNIPIVSIDGFDLVKYGLVSSLSRPGGNITGVSYLAADLGSKRLGLLQELVPQATTVAYLAGFSRGALPEDMRNDIVAAARTIQLEIVEGVAQSSRDFEPVFVDFIKRGAAALIVGQYSFLANNQQKVVALAARYKIPTMYPVAPYVRAGGLISYGVDARGSYRQAAALHVAQIWEAARGRTH